MRIPASLHKKLRLHAQKLGVSLNNLCRDKLEATIEKSHISSSHSASIGLPSLLDRWGDTLLGIVLFGSVPRGEQTNASDVDLLVVLDSQVQLSRELYLEWDDKFDRALTSEWQAQVNPHFVHLAENPLEAGSLWYEIALDGVILWEKHYKITQFLRQIRELILQGRLKRLLSHGHPYWVKQPDTKDTAA